MILIEYLKGKSGVFERKALLFVANDFKYRVAFLLEGLFHKRRLYLSYEETRRIGWSGLLNWATIVQINAHAVFHWIVWSIRDYSQAAAILAGTLLSPA